MIEEVLKRRFFHKDWLYPDLLVIDGGKPQVSKATDVLKERELSIPIIGLAKRQEEIIIRKDNVYHILRLPLTHPGIQILQQIRDEAHRFAKRYHVLIRNKALV